MIKGNIVAFRFFGVDELCCARDYAEGQGVTRVSQHKKFGIIKDVTRFLKIKKYHL